MLVLPAAIVLLSVSAAALLGYATGLEFTYQWGGTTRMAVHTAAAFLLLGTGVFVSGWRQMDRGRQIWLAVGGGGCIAGIAVGRFAGIDDGATTSRCGRVPHRGRQRGGRGGEQCR